MRGRTNEAKPNNLACIVDSVGDAAKTAGERPEVRHRAILPEERMIHIRGVGTVADDLVRIVDSVCNALSVAG